MVDFCSRRRKMEQFEQLLTCAICLDRYRNPKLLPCQHSFCMEPCMEGLVDYVRRQVKCPECRAEHRIPYQGVQVIRTQSKTTKNFFGGLIINNFLGLSNKCNVTKVPGTPYRNIWRASRSNSWTNDGKMCSLFRKSILQPLRSL